MHRAAPQTPGFARAPPAPAQHPAVGSRATAATPPSTDARDPRATPPSTSRHTRGDAPATTARAPLPPLARAPRRMAVTDQSAPATKPPIHRLGHRARPASAFRRAPRYACAVLRADQRAARAHARAQRDPAHPRAAVATTAADRRIPRRDRRTKAVVAAPKWVGKRFERGQQIGLVRLQTRAQVYVEGTRRSTNSQLSRDCVEFDLAGLQLAQQLLGVWMHAPRVLRMVERAFDLGCAGHGTYVSKAGRFG